VTDAVSRPFRAIARRLRPSATTGPGASPATEEFWALKDVSFDVQRGTVLGIVGRNGAGKSTLLKILSRITEPTRGRIEIEGRVASLLEVGTGFHPELTGRENIFMNGAILGMSRAEIRKKFDEIVAFAEVDRFLDTPVKRFSSGMYVRLAFAIAAHLEPEILVVDEVLAVGDAQFQKKCIGKMEDVSRQEGRTVLFVSHNTGMIAQLCNRALLLDAGQILMHGETGAVVDRYVNQRPDEVSEIGMAHTAGDNHFTRVYLTDRSGEKRDQFKFDEEVIVATEIQLDKFTPDLELGLRLIDRHKNPVFTIAERLDKHRGSNGNLLRLNIVIPPVFIVPGRYSWVAVIHQPSVKIHALHDDVLPFHVLDTGTEFAKYGDVNYGSVFARYSVENVTATAAREAKPRVIA
jgi:lipopolysaccharide transport system ATP-binding protein